MLRFQRDLPALMMSAGLQCPAPLAYLKAYQTVTEARTSIGRYFASTILDHPDTANEFSGLAADPSKHRVEDPGHVG
jgi:hypothetical protein